MDINQLDNKVHSFIGLLNRSGYGSSNPDTDRYGNLESQVRAYLVSAQEFEPYDHLKAFIDGDDAEEPIFKLHSTGMMSKEQIKFTFHCQEEHPQVSVKKIEMMINNASLIIPVKGPLPHIEFCCELYRLRFPQLTASKSERTIEPDNLKNRKGI